MAEAEGAATRRLSVRVPAAPAREYEVLVGEGALARLGELCREAAPAHRYALIADSRVGELYGRTAVEALGAADLEADLFLFPAGEWNKTREEWARLTDGMLRAGFGRDAAVVALGGGVTGDLASFVAATYMRGLPVVQVPTSLLAMVDSSVGGKAAVDTGVGKNLVGAFHHPSLVVIDPSLLATLPGPHLAAGLVEVVKVAAVRDASFFAWLEAEAGRLREGDRDALAEAIVRAVAHKAEVVEADPRESGGRAVLNFGHTVGHALELLGGYAVLHGEAVAAGMRAEARLGERLEVTEPGTAARLASLLEACGAGRGTVEVPRPDRLREAVRVDKKGRAGSPRCVLLRRIGEVARSPEGAHAFPLDEAAWGHLGAALAVERDPAPG